jgi:hypothetical protein
VPGSLGERASGSFSGSEAARAGPRATGREREQVCIGVFHVQGLDITMVVLVVTCSVSVQQRGVFYIWYICSSKHFSLLLCSYMALFVRVCVMMGIEIYIFIFDTSYMVVIIGMYGLYVEVELYIYI